MKGEHDHRTWKANPGKGRKPRDVEKRVYIMYRNGQVFGPLRAGDRDWKHSDSDWDIVKFADA